MKVKKSKFTRIISAFMMIAMIFGVIGGWTPKASAAASYKINITVVYPDKRTETVTTACGSGANLYTLVCSKTAEYVSTFAGYSRGAMSYRPTVAPSSTKINLTSTTKVPSYNTNVTVCLVPRSAEVTFDYNYSGTTSFKKKATSGQTFQQVTGRVAPTRSGYKFLGWSTRKNGSNFIYLHSDPIVVSGGVTYYAIWDKIKGSKEGEKKYYYQSFTRADAEKILLRAGDGMSSSQKKDFFDVALAIAGIIPGVPYIVSLGVTGISELKAASASVNNDLLASTTNDKVWDIFRVVLANKGLQQLTIRIECKWNSIRKGGYLFEFWSVSDIALESWAATPLH